MKKFSFIKDVQTKFPELAVLANQEHIYKFGDEDFELDSLWFESFANTVNREMSYGKGLETCQLVFNYFSEVFEKGVPEIRNCIDVSFVENLFWKVSSENSEIYWQLLPENLKHLYLGFHGKVPF
jgi:hypothetical protein